MRRLVAIVALALSAAGLWITTFPTQAECVASGRAVDPTERHCQSANGYEQLQEHIWFHASQVLAGAGVVVLASYGGYRLYRHGRSWKTRERPSVM